MEMNLLHVHGRSIGYGRLGVDLAAALREKGVHIHDSLPGPSADHHPEPGYSSGISKVICWVSVPTHAQGWYVNQVPVIFSMWEATNLPESFRETLHEFDTVIVPSRQNLELFSRYHDNVKFVPLGIHTQDWAYQPRNLGTPFFNFLIGGSGPRKGTDLAYKAFIEVFGEDGSWPKDGPIPRLILKNPRGEDFPHHNRVTMVAGRLSDEDEIALYAAAHCYLQPSRGEGFGLQPLQAIAQGCPTILTAAHGHDAFANLGIGIDATHSESAYFIYGDAGDWWEPDFDQLCHAMEDVYDNYDTHLKIADGRSKIAHEKFSWSTVADNFIDAIGRDRLIGLDTPGEWVSPHRRRYLVITTRDWSADIAGIKYHFTKGKEHWELADVKRILFEAGLLDPKCLISGTDDPLDVGLTEHQLGRVEEYAASAAYCPHCGVKANTGVTRESELSEGA